MRPHDPMTAIPEGGSWLLQTPGIINWPMLLSLLSSYLSNSPNGLLSLPLTLRIALLPLAGRVSSIVLQLIGKDWLIWPSSMQIPAWPLTSNLSYTIVKINRQLILVQFNIYLSNRNLFHVFKELSWWRERGIVKNVRGLGFYPACKLTRYPAIL